MKMEIITKKGLSCWALTALLLGGGSSAMAGIGADMHALDKACQGDAATASCTGEAGTGLVNCLNAYQANQLQTDPAFAFSSGCQTELSQFEGSGELKEAGQINSACSTDSQTAGCASQNPNCATDAVGCGLLKCLVDYGKQQPVGFQFSPSCQAILNQVDPQVLQTVANAEAAAAPPPPPPLDCGGQTTCAAYCSTVIPNYPMQPSCSANTCNCAGPWVGTRSVTCNGTCQ